MIKQLTAAKLNIAATNALLSATCADFRYPAVTGKTISEWIIYCEGLCGENKGTISSSGCIEALNAFDNSEDIIFDTTPSPFDRPPVDNFGNISGADPSGFTAAHSGGYVIGKKIGSNDCR